MVCDEFQPYLDFRNLIIQVDEQIIFTGNVAPIAAGRGPATRRHKTPCAVLERRCSQRTIQHRPRYVGTFPEPDMTLTRRAAV